MAPAKDVKKSTGRSITDFFAPWVRRAPTTAPAPEPTPTPSSRPTINNNSNDDNDDVIVVARPTNSSPSSRSSTSITPPKRGPGRPRKSESQDISPTKRGRGRPKKSESQQMRDNQLKPINSDIESRASTPKRKKYNVNPVNGKADVTPTKDSPYRSGSETSGKRRIAAVVEIPSPLKGRKGQTITNEEMGSILGKPSGGAGDAGATDAKEDGTANLVPGAFVDKTEEQTVSTAIEPPPRLPAVPSQPPESTAPSASHSSIATLATAPASSATPNPLNSSTSSRRVTQDGLKGVTNSDSEDDSSSDDEGPFRSLSSFCQPMKRKPIGEAPSAPPSKIMKSSNPAVKKGFFKPFASPPRKVYKNSLKSLVAQHEKWQQSDAMIASMESAVEESKKRQEQAKLVNDEGLNEAALVDAAGSNDEDRERMIHALERTEALREKDSYRFFLDDKPLWSDAPFPVDCLPDEPWAAVYKTAKARYHACITGFAAYLASTHPLPMPVTGWIVTQLMYEQDEVLCEAYVEILRTTAAYPTSISNSISSLSSIYKTQSFFEYGNKETVPKSGLPPGLKYIVRVAECCAPMTDSEVPEAVPGQTCAAFLDLMLVNIDERVRGNIDLSLQVAKCIEGMLDALPEESFSKLIAEATGMVSGTSDLSPKNRYRAISSLPAGTIRANKIRRRLALECFSTAADRKHSHSQDWPNSILKSLARNPAFQMSEKTDYRLLQELIKVLDIAISAGWTAYSQIIPGAPSGPFGRLPEPSEAEKQHNLQIDNIVARLTGIAAKIRDAGTSHLARTEAKLAIERLIRRLELQVRSRVKPAKGVFNEASRQATLTGFGKKQEGPAKVSFKEQVEVMPREKSSEVEDESFRTAEDVSLMDSGIVMKSSPPVIDT